MAQSLNSRSRQIASVELPKHFRGPQREVLSADAAVVNLRRLSNYYYSVGTRLLSFEHTESDDVAKSLLQVTLKMLLVELGDSAVQNFN